MNIYILDEDPMLSARYHMDAHVLQLCREACAFLAAAHLVRIPESISMRAPDWLPWTRWTSRSIQHYSFIVMHASCLAREGRRREMDMTACDIEIDWLQRNIPGHLRHSPLTPFPLCLKDRLIECIPERHVSHEDFAHIYPSHDVIGLTVLAYRRYYKIEKARLAGWKIDGPPDWWESTYSLQLDMFAR